MYNKNQSKWHFFLCHASSCYVTEFRDIYSHARKDKKCQRKTVTHTWEKSFRMLYVKVRVEQQNNGFDINSIHKNYTKSYRDVLDLDIGNVFRYNKQKKGRKSVDNNFNWPASCDSVITETNNFFDLPRHFHAWQMDLVVHVPNIFLDWRMYQRKWVSFDIALSHQVVYSLVLMVLSCQASGITK